MLAWLALPGTESRVKVAALLSSPGTSCVVGGAVPVLTGTEVATRVHLVFRCLHRDVIGDPVCRVGPEIGRDLLGRAQARAKVVADVARSDAELQSPRAIDLDVEIGRVDLLLQMGVDNAWDGGDAATQLLGYVQVLDPVVT